MQLSARLFSIITFLVSLGFVAQALPTTAKGGALAAREYSSPASYGNGSPSYGTPPYGDVDPSSKDLDILAIFTNFEAEYQPILADIAVVVDVATLNAKVDLLVEKMHALVICLKVTVQLSASDKARVVELFLNFFLACIKVCADVSIRLGVEACAGIWVKLDICFKLLIVAFDFCIGGFIGLLISACAKLDVSVFTALKTVHLSACIDLLQVLKVALGLGVAL
ncbi:hypothetical protein FRC12_016935 [Ceratobasidium sp. 428]|nr:hypothetical protein FRC12_016935 [Ceratobasidium sp. 428]